jgi:NAD(P)-dependent dehydrogenase (short-subunit alcohol dehydrogenase family)
MDNSQLQQISKALSDPRRFQLLKRIAASPEIGCSDIRCEFPISAATLSHHIKELSQAGLITVRKSAKFAYLALNPPAAGSVYSATKASVDAITRSLAQELGPRKIRVNCLSPGVTETEGLRASVGGGEGFKQLALARTPLGRVGTAEDIASVALFLASDGSGWITGETLVAGGGLRI